MGRPSFFFASKLPLLAPVIIDGYLLKTTSRGVLRCASP